MKWLYEQKGEIAPVLSEKAVDCMNCSVQPPLTRAMEYTVETKCCEFSPFLSAFAAGALLHEGADLERFYSQAQGELVLTRLGILHNLQHRKKRRLCAFYNKPQRSCQIWHHRPATCFTFFCVTEKTKRWESIEIELLESEADWLHHWHVHKKGSADDWARWGLVMEEQPVIEIPETLLIRQWDQAEPYFREAYRWLKENPAEISETL